MKLAGTIALLVDWHRGMYLPVLAWKHHRCDCNKGVSSFSWKASLDFLSRVEGAPRPAFIQPVGQGSQCESEVAMGRSGQALPKA